MLDVVIKSYISLDIAMYLSFFSAAISFLLINPARMFSGKKSGLTVLMIYTCYVMLLTLNKNYLLIDLAPLSSGRCLRIALSLTQSCNRFFTVNSDRFGTLTILTSALSRAYDISEYNVDVMITYQLSSSEDFSKELYSALWIWW